MRSVSLPPGPAGSAELPSRGPALAPTRLTPTLTVCEEAGFYDAVYGRCLELPDDSLVWNAALLRSSVEDPRHPFFERRRLFLTALHALETIGMAGRTALDYGCGTGDWGVLMACAGAEVTLVDLSPVGVEVGLRRARVSGVAHRVRGVSRDASDLSCFDDGAFDLVFAGAALHHTLKYPDALAELLRVLAARGFLVLAETYGNNRLLNGARRFRARLAHEPKEQGEGIILSDEDLELLRPHFANVECAPLNLLAMAKRLFRGRYHLCGVRLLLSVLERADALLLRAVPQLERFCGEVVVVARR